MASLIDIIIPNENTQIRDASPSSSNLSLSSSAEGITCNAYEVNETGGAYKIVPTGFDLNLNNNNWSFVFWIKPPYDNIVSTSARHHFLELGNYYIDNQTSITFGHQTNSSTPRFCLTFYQNKVSTPSMYFSEDLTVTDYQNWQLIEVSCNNNIITLRGFFKESGYQEISKGVDWDTNLYPFANNITIGGYGWDTDAWRTGEFQNVRVYDGTLSYKQFIELTKKEVFNYSMQTPTAEATVNYLVNGNFEDGMENWGIGGAAVTSSLRDTKYGKGVLLERGDGTNGDFNLYYSGLKPPFIAGETWTWSFKVKLVAGTLSDFYIGWWITDNGSLRHSLTKTSAIDLGDSWYQVHCIYTWVETHYGSYTCGVNSLRDYVSFVFADMKLERRKFGTSTIGYNNFNENYHLADSTGNHNISLVPDNDLLEIDPTRTYGMTWDVGKFYKTRRTNSWDSGIVSKYSITGDCELEFTAVFDSGFGLDMLGLDTTNDVGYSYGNILHKIYIHTNNNVYTYNAANSSTVSSTWVHTTPTTFKVKVAGTDTFFYQNGSLIQTYTGEHSAGATWWVTTSNHSHGGNGAGKCCLYDVKFRSLTTDIDPLPNYDNINHILNFDGTQALKMKEYSFIGGRDYTMAAWVYLEEDSAGVGASGQYILSNISTNGLKFSIETTGAESVNLIRVGAAGAVRSTAGFDSLEWHHVTVTVSESALTKFYIDGELSSSTTNSNALISSISSDMYMGSDGSSSGFLNGSLKDVRFFQSELSATNVKALFATKYSLDNGGNLWLN